MEELKAAAAKITISGLTAFIAHITLSNIAAALSIIYSAVALYKLLKKK